MAEKLYLVDGMALVYRSYYALSKANLTHSSGLPTGAIYGFIKTLFKLIKEKRPAYLGVAWDGPGKTVRHIQYEAYKAHRPEMPEDLKCQLDYIQEGIEALEIPFLVFPGYEADDILASFSKEAVRQGLEVRIVSGDKDLMQLVSSKIHMISLDRQGEMIEIGPKEVEEKFGVKPSQIRDYLALVGDASDNVPGVPGIGAKRARKLLQEWGSVENILKNLPRLGSSRIIKALESNQEVLELSKQLVTLHENLDLSFSRESLKWTGPNSDKFLNFLEKMEFKSLAQEFRKNILDGKGDGLSLSPINQRDNKKVHSSSSYQVFQVLDLLKWEGLAQKLGKGKLFFFWNQFFWENPVKGDLQKSFFLFRDKIYVINWIELHKSEKSEWFQIFQNLWSSPSLKIGFHLKEDIKYFLSQNISFQNFYDLMIAYYVVHPTESAKEPTLEEVIQKICQLSLSEVRPKSQKQLWGEEETKTPLISFFPKLYESIKKEVSQWKLESLLKELEIPLIQVLAQMELEGVSIDIQKLENLKKEIQSQLEKLESEIYQLSGEKWNIQSSQQAAHILFEKLEIHKKLGIRKLKKTKTGYSTDQSVLEELSAHPLPRLILAFRQKSKLVNTYMAPLPKWIQKNTGKIHTTFHQALTATGRLSSSHPNLQNIPIRSEMGRNIREAFVPSHADFYLLSADYSQIELRLLAHFSKDPTLCQAFMEDQDIHIATAAKLFKVAPEEVTSQMRSRAKAVNFGILYGMGPKRLAKSEGLPLNEAKKFIQNYFSLYPCIKEYMDQQLERARKEKKVTTLLGRIRFLEGIDSSNTRIKAEMERIAINTPIQGSASDIIKLAMVAIFSKFQSHQYKAKMILQIHDELLFEVHEKEIQKVQTMVKSTMEGVVNLEIPLKVEIGLGKNWLEAH